MYGCKEIALAVAWIGFAYWVGLALDYLPVLVGSDEMPRAARAVLITAVSAVLVWILYRWVLRRAFVRLGDGKHGAPIGEDGFPNSKMRCSRPSARQILKERQNLPMSKLRWSSAPSIWPANGRPMWTLAKSST